MRHVQPTTPKGDEVQITPTSATEPCCQNSSRSLCAHNRLICRGSRTELFCAKPDRTHRRTLCDTREFRRA